MLLRFRKRLNWFSSYEKEYFLYIREGLLKALVFIPSKLYLLPKLSATKG